MQNRDNDDFSGAESVAKFLFDAGVTKDEFQRDPNRWIELAIRSLKSNIQPKKAVNEAGTVGGASVTGDIKGFFEPAIDRAKRRKFKKHPKHQ